MKYFFLIAAICFLIVACRNSSSKEANKQTSLKNQDANSQTASQSTMESQQSSTNYSEPGQGDIIVNDVKWTENEIASFTKIYGMAPKPGNYWYDAVSGLYGLAGQPAAGFLYPGHNYGKLSPNASNGRTNVFINNRQLPQSEWLILSSICGTYVQPGYYWMDAQGNAGVQGNPNPWINLFAAARQNHYSSGGGDNFWSSRFGAGNSDGNSGYVNVPGYGPVGYGDY